MNATRRKAINRLNAELFDIQSLYTEALQPLLELTQELDDIAAEINELRNAEQGAFDKLSKAKQGDDYGLFMNDCIIALETAQEEVVRFSSRIEDLGSDGNPLSEALGKLSDAAYEPD